jgi:DNA mismatch endonuclease, patch repair protein
MSRWAKPDNQAKTTFGGLSRSALMSRIRCSQNATTELRFLALLRTARINGWRRNYPLTGKPDFAFPKSKLAVFIDGCFWHGHDCGRNLNPKHNAHAWKVKIAGNKGRDLVVSRELKRRGWKVIRIWECTLKKRPNHCIKRVVRFFAQCRISRSAIRGAAKARTF